MIDTRSETMHQIEGGFGRVLDRVGAHADVNLARAIPAMIGAVGKLALAASRGPQGHSIFGPGSLTVTRARRKRAPDNNEEERGDGWSA